MLALLSKTVTATLPAALLVVLWWQRKRLSWKRDALPLLPWFALGATAGLVTAWVERRYIHAEGASFALTLGERCLLAGRVIWFYLGKALWPVNLMFTYPIKTIRPSQEAVSERIGIPDCYEDSEHGDRLAPAGAPRHSSTDTARQSNRGGGHRHAYQRVGDRRSADQGDRVPQRNQDDCGPVASTHMLATDPQPCLSAISSPEAPWKHWPAWPTLLARRRFKDYLGIWWELVRARTAISDSVPWENSRMGVRVRPSTSTKK